jgi:hypothetical protein
MLTGNTPLTSLPRAVQPESFSHPLPWSDRGKQRVELVYSNFCGSGLGTSAERFSESSVRKTVEVEWRI